MHQYRYLCLRHKETILISKNRSLAHGTCSGKQVIKLVSLLTMGIGNFSTAESKLVSLFLILTSLKWYSAQAYYQREVKSQRSKSIGLEAQTYTEGIQIDLVF